MSSIYKEDANVYVGVITSSFGVKGAVKIHSNFHLPFVLKKYQHFWDAEGNKYVFSIFNIKKNIIYTYISNVCTCNDAEKLINWK